MSTSRTGDSPHLRPSLCPRVRPSTGEIDWPRRFDHMQQHSGEHIVSGMLCAAYNCDNTGFHLGEGSVIIDYNADIPWEGVLDIEARANRYLWENHSLVTLYPTAQELAALPYRSKKELTGQVRITQFPGPTMRLLRNPCVPIRPGGAGEIHRLAEIPGRRAPGAAVRPAGLEYLALSWQQNSAVGRELSVKPDKTAQAVERLLGEVQSLKARCAGLEEAEFHRLAEEYRSAGNVLLVQSSMEPDSVRRLCDAVSRTCSGRCAVFAGTDGGYKYAVIHPEQDITPFMKAMNAAPPWPGRRTGWLCPGQRRLHGGGNSPFLGRKYIKYENGRNISYFWTISVFSFHRKDVILF